MVMDDLKMEPISADNFITLLNEYDIADGGALEKKVVVVGKDETILTDAFLSRPIEIKESIETYIGTSDEMLKDDESVMVHDRTTLPMPPL
ncbi:uncharacterized protein LOC109008955 isoform X2 [Juglans regia]|uniref:Uncharacterized protein LOC109008955 isoform X2 n=1 Tax=Juglans regia TaxID=51240 RepID=A0A2I4GLN6_JUGRE|nr:uncharacterized protein LOC109008955 isoform X2 [Juglans regia]